MELRSDNKQINQLALRTELEQNLDVITDIFKTYYEDDYKKLVPELLEVFKGANPYLNHNLIEKSIHLSVESKLLIKERLKRTELYLKKSIKNTIQSHLGQYRNSGVHYASHPMHNGYLISAFGFGENMIISANLHDVLEENEDKIDELSDNIKKTFNQEVLDNVATLSIFEKGETRDELLMKQLWFASEQTGNSNVLYLKLVDVISNLYTKKFMHGKNGMNSEARQRKYENTTRKHILPIAKLIDASNELDLNVNSYLNYLLER